VIVRPATEADMAAILELGRAMAAESPRWAAMPYSTEKVAVVSRRSIEQGGAFAAVHEREPGDEGVVGVLVGIMAQHWFSTTWYAGTLAVYVMPAFRGGVAFRLLMGEFERWGASRGASELCVGVHTGQADERVARAYRAHGYLDAGVNLVKPVDPVRADG